MKERWKHKTWLIDLDGTMYRGKKQIPGAIELISYLQKEKIPYCFVTNDAMRTKKQNVAHMEALGFHGIKEDEFFTSAMAAARYVARMSDRRNAYYIGEDGLREALLENGFTIVDDHSDFVFVGLSRSKTYMDYSKAFEQLWNGAKLIGTNCDRRLADGDHFLIGNGSIVEMLAYASEQESLKLGKPYAPMLEETLAYLNKQKEDCIILGDNMETDIAFGALHGVETILVESGVHTAADCARYAFAPSACYHDLFACMDDE